MLQYETFSPLGHMVRPALRCARNNASFYMAGAAITLAFYRARQAVKDARKFDSFGDRLRVAMTRAPISRCLSGTTAPSSRSSRAVQSLNRAELLTVRHAMTFAS
jgi:hypothetical protein